VSVAPQCVFIEPAWCLLIIIFHFSAAAQNIITPSKRHNKKTYTNSRLAKPAVSSPKAEAASLTSAMAASISGVMSVLAFRAVRGTNIGFLDTNAAVDGTESAVMMSERYFIVGLLVDVVAVACNRDNCLC
jgi:hypothetical protein